MSKFGRVSSPEIDHHARQVLMNPLYRPSGPIQSKDFLAKVKAAARKYL